MLSGFLGLAVFKLSLKEPLLPLFSGLFGASTLLNSLKNEQQIPQQELLPIKETNFHIKKPFFASLLAAPLCSFLPGLGSSQAAIIGSDILDETKKEEFLTLIGCINTLVMALSFVVLYAINKARTGAASAVSELIKLSQRELVIILIIIIAVSILSSILAVSISKKFSKYVSKIPYPKLSLFVLLFLVTQK
ncbi:MAG: tripartite tricarboxylate transporter permease, partial [Nanoarchaeota archaeon]